MSRGVYRGMALACALLWMGIEAHCAPGGARLVITYPPRDLVTRHMRVRIAGSCAPGGTVRINGTQVKVYPTGAFVGLVPLKEGDNNIEIAARGGGATGEERLTVRCVEPLRTSPASPLTIDAARGEPAVATTLQEGDLLCVQCKGSPGVTARWSLAGCVSEAPMEEVKPATTGELAGIAGIYRASYRIKRGDRVRRQSVQFTLRAPDGTSLAASSPGRVTLLPHAQVMRGTIAGCGAAMTAEPGGKTVFMADPGARVDICGEAGDCYRVNFAPGERYWAKKTSVKPAGGRGAWEPVKPGPPSLVPTESGTALVVPLKAILPWRMSTAEGDGGVLGLTIAGVEPPARDIVLEGAGPLRAASIAAGGGTVLRVTLWPRGRGAWGYSGRYVEEGFRFELVESPGKKLKDAVVVLDPGHGGLQTGAVSPTGLLEKEVNLRVALAAEEYLKGRGGRVVLTRRDDETLSPGERIERARRAGAHLFVSIHHNSLAGYCDPLEKRGADAYYAAAHSRPLAGQILAALARVAAKINSVHEENFAVIMPTEYPAVLVECGYLSHPEDEALLLKKNYYREAGRAVGRGIEEFIRAGI